MSLLERRSFCFSYHLVSFSGCSFQCKVSTSICPDFFSLANLLCEPLGVDTGNLLGAES